MYTLILTIVAWSSDGSAIDHISGFKTLDACLRAGNQWTRLISQAEGRGFPRAMCVRIEQ